MYHLLITSDRIADALMETSLGEYIRSRGTRDGKGDAKQHSDDIPTYVLSIADGMKLNDTPQKIADIIHFAIIHYHPDVLMLDNMNSRAVLRKSGSKMRQEGTKYMLVEGALFSPAPKKAIKESPRAVSKQEKKEEVAEMSTNGKVVLGVLALAIAVAVVGGLASASNTRDESGSKR